MKKELGVLCHVSSLYGEYGIGDFGKSSFEFIDFLHKNNFNLWQILPLNKINEYNCPYASICCYSMDEMFLSLEEFLENGTIKLEDLKFLKKLSTTRKVAYSMVKAEKLKILDKIYSTLTNKDKKEIEKQAKKHFWLLDYAYFQAVLNVFNVQDFRMISNEFWNKNSKRYQEFKKEHSNEIIKIAYFQLKLIEQWGKVKKYANEKGIKILGDMPIYPDKKSFEVFANSNQFKLDKNKEPTVFGGVPADDFCADGQNWGTCIYDWKEMQKDNYNFMIGKIKHALTNYDILRLDHFFGYVKHYEWNAKKEKTGKWVKTDGEDFFSCLKKEVALNNLVIEDLGFNLKEANEIKNKFNLKGMSVMQMCLTGEHNNRYLPEYVKQNEMYFLGTHDNNTFVGFLKDLNKEEKTRFCNLIKIENKNNKQILIDAIKKMKNSESETIVLTMQDLMLQDSKSRMNIPGQMANCWEYKMPKNYQKKANKVLKQIKI
ncbi:MAG: 4-alpha-glucanotransferase [Clostridia bacterium]|nr:4-alpha-glucanotransferase [Clostridia bacterium]